MNIGSVAERCGISAKTIRYYEDIGLIQRAERRANGYRSYSAIEARELQFIQRARSLGFSVQEVRELLDLWRHRTRPSSAVKAVATRHLQALDRKIDELNAVRATIAALVTHCRGDSRPDCPILESLQASEGVSRGRGSITATTPNTGRSRSR
ncbi:MAG: Cu(I)-responsive transcriptional regulator [Pseudomonadota bacterium]|nr:Cu(I)-responsive transcriptional regulator [Pseudomonadota bacterium]